MFTHNQTRIYHRTVVPVKVSQPADRITTAIAFQQADEFNPATDICLCVKRTPVTAGNQRDIWLMPQESTMSFDSSFANALVEDRMYFLADGNELERFGIADTLNLIADIAAAQRVASSERDFVRHINAATGFSRKQKWLYWFDTALRVLTNTCNQRMHTMEKGTSAMPLIEPDFPFVSSGNALVNDSIGKMEVCSAFNFPPGIASIGCHWQLTRIQKADFRDSSDQLIFSGDNILLTHVGDGAGEILSVSPLLLPPLKLQPICSAGGIGPHKCFCQSFQSFAKDGADEGKPECAGEGPKVLAVAANGDSAAKFSLLEQAMYEVLETSATAGATYYRLRNDHGEEVWLNAERTTPMAYA